MNFYDLCKSVYDFYKRYTSLESKLKLGVTLLAIVCLQASAAGFSQQITLSEKNAPLNKVLQEIRRQSGYSLLYNTDLVQQASLVSIDVQNASLEDALQLTVKNQPFNYQLSGKTVLITPKAKANGVVAATIDVKGKVTDEKGLPLPGASVKVKGGNLGTMTDSNGSFTLRSVDNQAILHISFLGYKAKEVKAASDMGVIALEPEESELNEVVVIGYGTQKKSETTGSSANVKGSALANQPVTSFESALNGRATGVNMIANAGVVNQAPVFRIRGTNSLSLSSYPLIVIDGVPTFTTSENESNISYASNNPLSSINPADIESVDIAKDAAATSIYGSRAANGVIFITTKKGKQGAAKVTYETWAGFTTASRLPQLLNAQQYVEIKNEGLRNDNSYNSTTNFYSLSYGANGEAIDTKWSDHIYHTGFSQSHNLNISGANQATSFYGSAGYVNQEGIFQKNGFSRKSGMFNIDNKTTNWLNVGAKINYVNESNLSAMSTGVGGGSFQSSSSTGVMSRVAMITAPIASPFNKDGSYNTTSSGFVGLQDNNGHLNQSRLGFYNPVISLATNYSNNYVNHIQANAFVKVAPWSWLSLKSVYGVDNRYTTYKNYFSPISGEGLGNNGSASNVHVNRQRWVWTNTATIEKVLAKNHNFTVLLGQEQQKTDGDQFGLQRQGQSDPFYTNIQGGWQNVFVYNTNNQVFDNYLFSLFSRAQYNYLKKYFLTANYRQDEYSALGANNKRGTFWGFSAGWEIMKESFWANSALDNIFSNLKLRASYGKVGNIGGLTDFGALNTYSASLYGGQPGLSYSATGNPELMWETSKKTDIGLSFGVLNDRISGELSYYRNDIDGLIFGVPLPPSVGIPNSSTNSILQNVGRMYNQGVELSVTGTAVRTQKFSWLSSINLTSNMNKVVSLTEGVPSIIAGSLDGMSITLPGYSVGMIYAVRTAGVDPATGRRIFLDKDGKKVFYQQAVFAGSGGAAYQWSYEDGSRAPAITPADDAIAYKASMPRLFGGLNNTFQFKGLELNVLLTYQLGGYMMNGTQSTLRDQRFWNNSVDVLRRWQKSGDLTDIPKVVNNDNVSNGNTMPIDANVSSTDFLRLKNMTLGYSLPAAIMKKTPIHNIRIYVSGQNLALFTKYTGMDPEVTTNGNDAIRQGIDKNQSPNARTITFGLTAGF